MVFSSALLRLKYGLLQPSTSRLLTETIKQFSVTATYFSGDMIGHMHRQGGAPPRRSRSKLKSPISGYPYLKGIVLKTVIRHPKKPDSGNRKCAIVKLSNGAEVCAYIPGVGHNLQEHSQVQVQGGRRRDLIGVKTNVIRGRLDCAPTKKGKK